MNTSQILTAKLGNNKKTKGVFEAENTFKNLTNVLLKGNKGLRDLHDSLVQISRNAFYTVYFQKNALPKV